MGALVAGAGGVESVYRDVNGDLATSTSSLRYKTAVNNLEPILSQLMKLRPVRFKWGNNTSTPGMDDFGMIAEEVNSVLPDLVLFNSDGTPRGLKYEKMGLFALKGLQELASSANEQQAQFDALGGSFRITDSQENTVLFGNRDIYPSQNRDMTLTADTINLNGSVMANGLNLNTAIGNLADNQNVIVSELTGILTDANETTENKILAIGENLARLQVAEATLEEWKMQYDNQVIDLNELKEKMEELSGSNQALLANISTDAFIDLAASLNTGLMIYKDAAGNVDIGGGKIIAEKIQAQSAEFSGGVVAGAFTVKVVDPAKKTIGEAFICPAGRVYDSSVQDCATSTDPAIDGTFVEVKTTAATNTCKIFITPESNLGSVWVEKEADNSGFKIKIQPESPLTSKVKISWFIIEEE
ncbi:MAG: hypothetical protein A2288_03005 [Candidatus Moranbacteria bacterium RIFOXYA12_FULL_44_15]|nr:MAG: hypothetical protein A2288_03005 [Candidatus Moranbacteria bacterium RIFOXYA12_FULL_44_15]OGI35421.1 MAG: hypothetical protein A2259_03090 [Candidatus Moranbacteria bacterium RIFOXYA2_FULL_43_15]